MQSKGTFPFGFGWESASEGVTDFRFLLHAPAGSQGAVRAGKDGHYYTGTRRIKFFGVNFTAGANFPPRSDAPKVAERLARAGINCVRFHHMDAEWSDPALIDYSQRTSRTLNPRALDRFDYFFAELKKRGIYANINLLVNRRFFAKDGLPNAIESVREVKDQHGIGFFYEPLIALQKEYAQQILTHRNPYTNLTYAEDPAVAIIEINNENGCLQSWFLGVYDRMPEPFQQALREQWNAWLQQRYRSSEQLRSVWGERDSPLGPQLLQNADFAQGTDHWVLEQHGSAHASWERIEGIAAIRIIRASRSRLARAVSSTEPHHIARNTLYHPV